MFTFIFKKTRKKKKGGGHINFPRILFSYITQQEQNLHSKGNFEKS